MATDPGRETVDVQDLPREVGNLIAFMARDDVPAEYHAAASLFALWYIHWYGVQVMNKLRPGKKLKLQGEPDNPYYPNAIAVYCGKTKIGFVPMAKNAELSKLLYFGYGKLFEARVSSTDWAQHPEAQVRMTIFVKDGR